MSIVLVIIGLIVGGVLIGQDLISAAATRAQITQIEKYNTAVNTFRVKYGYLPGDIPDPYASQFGFMARGSYPGQGDGDGIVEGTYGNSNQNLWGGDQQGGETIMLWQDLSTAKLIDGSFTSANCCGSAVAVSQTQLALYFPSAKIGSGNYVIARSAGVQVGAQWTPWPLNYFTVEALSNLDSGQNPNANPGLTVAQAYSIDKKIDDGFPQSGKVVALYMNNNGANDLFWAGTSFDNNGAPYTTLTAGSGTSCFDNSSSGTGTPGIPGATQHYSMEMSNGSGVNCALSFQMQGAAR